MELLSHDESRKVKEMLSRKMGLYSQIHNWDLMQLSKDCNQNRLRKWLIKKSPIFGILYFGNPLWEGMAARYEDYLVVDTQLLSNSKVLTKFLTYLHQESIGTLIWFPRDGTVSSFRPEIPEGCCVKMSPSETCRLLVPSPTYVPDTYFFDEFARWVYCDVHEGFVYIGGTADFIAKLKCIAPELSSARYIGWEKQ